MNQIKPAHRYYAMFVTVCGFLMLFIGMAELMVMLWMPVTTGLLTFFAGLFLAVFGGLWWRGVSDALREN